MGHGTYRGKELDDMSKEELIQVILEMASSAQRTHEQTMRALGVLGRSRPYISPR